MSANDMFDLSLFLNISQIRFLSSISTCIAVISEPFTLTSVVTTPDVRNPATASNPPMVLLHNRPEDNCLPPTPSNADKARALGLVLLTTVPRLDNTCPKSSSPAVCIFFPISACPELIAWSDSPPPGRRSGRLCGTETGLRGHGNCIVWTGGQVCANGLRRKTERTGTAQPITRNHPSYCL